MSDNKYKLFRNYMVNELGIGREEIMEWTKEAVKEAVDKMLRAKDWDKEISRVIENQFSNRYATDQAIRSAVADILSNQYTVRIEKRE